MEELLHFVGHSLAYALDLYASNLVKPDSLCLGAVKREGRIQYLTYQEASIDVCHSSARKTLFQMENNGGYEMAVIVYDGYLRDRDSEERNEALLAQVFTLDTFADRRAVYRYTRKDNAYTPLRAPQLYGDWDYEQEEVDEIHLSKGVDLYFESKSLVK